MTNAIQRKQHLVAYGFVLPFFVVFATMLVAPLIYSGYLSFFVDRLVGGVSFVGFENYLRAFQDPGFLAGLGRTALFLVVQVPIMLGLALFFALALDSGLARGSKALRLLIFLPFAVPGVVAVLMWGYLYGQQFGLIAQITRAIGLPPTNLLSDSLILFSIMNIVTWAYVGYNMIVLYSALRSIPSDLYEAAEIDGASQWRLAWSVKIPLIRPAIVLTIIFSVIGSFQIFNEPKLLVEIAPTGITQSFTPNFYAYNLAFVNQDINYAAAIAFLLGFVIMIVSYVVQLSTHKKGAPVVTAQVTIPETAPRRKPYNRDNRRSNLLTVVMWLCVLYFIVPLIWLFMSSTKDNSDLFTTFGLWFGRDFNLFANIIDVFTYQDGIYLRWALNTILYAGVAAIGASLLATMAGYAFAKYQFPGREVLFSITLGAVMIPLTALAIPTYLLFSSAGITDTPWAVILPSLVSPFSVFLMRVYAADAVPDSLIEAARVDGAGEIRIFWQVAIRLLGPGIVTVTLFTLVATWNNYFLPLIMLNSGQLLPLTVGLAQQQATSAAGGGAQALFSTVITGSFVSIIPLIIAFLYLQRYWQTGLATGGVKG